MLACGSEFNIQSCVSIQALQRRKPGSWLAITSWNYGCVKCEWSGLLK